MRFSMKDVEALNHQFNKVNKITNVHHRAFGECFDSRCETGSSNEIEMLNFHLIFYRNMLTVFSVNINP